MCNLAIADWESHETDLEVTLEIDDAKETAPVSRGTAGQLWTVSQGGLASSTGNSDSVL